MDTLRNGDVRHVAGEGWYYLTVWVSTPGQPRNSAWRGPHPSADAARAARRRET